MAYGHLERKDLDAPFLAYLDEKWARYERSKKKAEARIGLPSALFWASKAYSYRMDYDVAMHNYEQRVAKAGGPKLEEK
jgi:hypothetical protein